MIIGLLGRAGSGKTTVSSWLVDEFGAWRFSFAAPLKQMAQQIYDLSHQQLYGTQAEKEAVDPRYGKSPRQLLQRLGTDICREILGPNVWINAALDGLEHTGEICVYDDVRFPNEVAAIQARGGFVVKLVCPDRPLAEHSDHPSEQIDDITTDFTIESRLADRDLIVRASALFTPILRGESFVDAVDAPQYEMTMRANLRRVQEASR